MNHKIDQDNESRALVHKKPLPHLVYGSAKQLTDDVLAKAKEDIKAELKEEGKPEKIWDRIIPGKMQRFIDDNTQVDKQFAVLSQNYIMDDSKTVGEFLNRLDAIVPFNSLTSEDMLKILDLYLVKMEKSLAKRNIKLHVTDDAKKYLAKKGYDKEFGARPLRRVVEQDLETPAAKLIVSKPDTKEVKFTIDDKHLYLNGEILEDVLFDKETREQEKKDIKEAEKADKKEEK